VFCKCVVCCGYYVSCCFVRLCCFCVYARLQIHCGSACEPNCRSFLWAKHFSFFPGSCQCAAVLFSQVPKQCRDLHLSLLYILILGTHSKFARKRIFSRSALSFRSPQAARVLAAGLPHQDHVYSTTDESLRFHNNKFDEMRCKLDSTENLRAFENPQPHLNTPSRFFLEKKFLELFRNLSSSLGKKIHVS